MHILHQLRFSVLLVLHCSPGKAGDPSMISSLICVTGWALYCSQCSTAESPDCRRHPPSPSLCPPDTGYCLILEEYKPNLIGECWLDIRCHHTPLSTFQMTLMPISVTAGRARCSSWPAPAWGRTWGTSAAPASRRARPSPCAGQGQPGGAILEYQ